jgi:ribonucleotide reductase alpha subunit
LEPWHSDIFEYL